MEIGIEPIGEMVLLAMENAREKMNVGLVEAVGPDAKSISVGDRVIYRQYSGTKIEWMGMDYLLIQEEDIQARVMG